MVELRCKPWQAVCSEPHCIHCLPPGWPGLELCCWDLESSKHMFGFALLGCLVAQTVGRSHRLDIHTWEDAQKHPGKWGPSSTIPLNAVFCQGMPKSTLKNNLAPGTNSQAYQGPRPVWAWEGTQAQMLLFHSGRKFDCGETQTCPWNEKLQKILTIHMGDILGLKKASKPQTGALCCKGALMITVAGGFL